MDDLLIILVRGIGAGSIFALVGMSFNVVFNSSGILNFAQGNMLVLAGLFAFLCLPGSPTAVQWLIFLPVITCLVAVLLAVQGAITLAPLRSSVEQHSWLITTLAASVIIGGILLIYQGSAQQSVRSPFPPVRFLGTRVPATYAITTGLAVFWCLALRWFHTRVLTGLAISAIAQVMNGFIAAVVGGLGSNFGALIGGVLVGVLSLYAAFEYGGEFQNVVSLALLVVVLMVRPQGLLGRQAARRV